MGRKGLFEVRILEPTDTLSSIRQAILSQVTVAIVPNLAEWNRDLSSSPLKRLIESEGLRIYEPDPLASD